MECVRVVLRVPVQVQQEMDRHKELVQTAVTNVVQLGNASRHADDNKFPFLKERSDSSLENKIGLPFKCLLFPIQISTNYKMLYQIYHQN